MLLRGASPFHAWAAGPGFVNAVQVQ